MHDLKVSVVTTLYNYREYISECIQSFLQQDFPHSEMIVIDDASEDEPYDVVYPLLSDRVKYIRLNKNQGYSHAKNVGIRATRAEILVMLDADDMLTRSGISARYNKLEEGYDLVHGPALDLSKGKTSPSRMTKKWLSTKSPKYIHAQGAMLRKKIHREIGLYDEELPSKSDREMFWRIYNRNYKIGWVKSPVAIYRRHSKQMHKSKAKLKINDKLQAMVKKRIKERKVDLGGLLFLK